MQAVGRTDDCELPLQRASQETPLFGIRVCPCSLARLHLPALGQVQAEAWCPTLWTS